MNEQAVGIDVSKRKLDVCVATGAKFKSKVFANTPAGHEALNTWLSERVSEHGTPVCLEASGPYSEAVAIALSDAGWRVSMVNPARVKGFAQSQLTRNKTDRVDAKLMALFAQQAELAVWQAPSPALRELRGLVERLQALIEMRQQELNRLEAMEQTAATSVDAMVREHIAWLDQQIARLESDIDDHIDGHPELKQDAGEWGTGEWGTDHELIVGSGELGAKTWSVPISPSGCAVWSRSGPRQCMGVPMHTSICRAVREPACQVLVRSRSILQ
ncbi:MAG: transposase [Halofilum sp. (in: g-proteobacteria)]